MLNVHRLVVVAVFLQCLCARKNWANASENSPPDLGADSFVSECSDYGNREDTYWNEVSKCGGCVSNKGCGYCLSTLNCVEGSSDGPLDRSPCPTWLYNETLCPGEFLSSRSL